MKVKELSDFLCHLRYSSLQRRANEKEMHIFCHIRKHGGSQILHTICYVPYVLSIQFDSRQICYHKIIDRLHRQKHGASRLYSFFSLLSFTHLFQPLAAFRQDATLRLGVQQDLSVLWN